MTDATNGIIAAVAQGDEMRWGLRARAGAGPQAYSRGTTKSLREILLVVAAGLSLTACQHRNAYEQALTGLSPQKQWCLRALYLMSNHRVADEGRMAIYEMAKNKGCFN